MNDVPRLILDANVMVSAMLGRSFPMFVELLGREVELFAPRAQLAEAQKILATRPHATGDWVDAQMQLLATVVEPIEPELYQRHESKARERLHSRGQPDWPMVAASIETGSAIWSHDKDFFGSGVAVWSTRILKRQLEQAV